MRLVCFDASLFAWINTEVTNELSAFESTDRDALVLTQVDDFPSLTTGVFPTSAFSDAQINPSLMDEGEGEVTIEDFDNDEVPTLLLLLLLLWMRSKRCCSAAHYVCAVAHCVCVCCSLCVYKVAEEFVSARTGHESPIAFYEESTTGGGSGSFGQYMQPGRAPSVPLPGALHQNTARSVTIRHNV